MTTATVTFDTLKFVRRLRDAGVEEKQAEAFSEAFRDIQDAQLKELATRGDIQDVKRDIKELEGKMREFEARVMGEIRLNRWMLALIIIVTVLPALKNLFG